MVRVALVKPSPAAIIQEHHHPEYPCLSLAYLSAILKINNVESLVIDGSFDGIPIDEMADSVIRFRPSIIGFTAMTHEIIHVARIAERLKKALPYSLIIVGGSHATVAPIEILKEFPIFDIAVIGEGEQTFKEILKELQIQIINKNSNEKIEISIIPIEKLRLISGIAWRLGNDVIINQAREQIQDLNSLPFPDYEHIKTRIKHYPIFSSRGCPNNCIFCCRIMGKKIRVRDPQNVVDEIKLAVTKFRPELIDFADETFTFPKGRAIKICDLIIKEGLKGKVKWKAQSRVTGVNQDLFDKMKEAGCVDVDFGVESGNDEMLKTIKKGITLDDTLKAVEAAKKAGLKTGSYFILGHPFETKETILDTINFATKLKTNSVAFGIMVPYPGTEVCEMAKHGEGGYRIISENWSDYDKQFGNALELDGLTRDQLEKSQRKAYLNFYLKNFRIATIVRLMISQRKLLWKMLTK